MSNVKTRIGGLLAIGCVVALMVAGATPAFAHHKGDHPQGQEGAASEAERFDEADDASGEDASSSDGSSSSGKSRRKNVDSQTTTTTTTSSDDGTPDGAGKNYDEEGEPRGQTSTSCPNSKSEPNDPNRVYSNTCDGRAGKAGSGSGSAQGRPCAGCVGNADDKLPSGQLKDGNNDGNAGYECDGNNGVARDNPAHTGCRRPPTTTQTCPTDPDLPLDHPDCDEVNPVKVCPSGPFEGLPMTSPRDCVGPDDRVLPNVIRNPAQPRAERVQAGAVLPFTGAGSVLTLFEAAVVMIGSGSLAVRARRKK